MVGVEPSSTARARRFQALTDPDGRGGLAAAREGWGTGRNRAAGGIRRRPRTCIARDCPTSREATMAEELAEEDLLRSMDEVDARIRKIRKRVRALLASIQATSQPSAATESTGNAG